MTPCEELGYKVGDKFEVVDGDASAFSKGSIIKLVKDGGTCYPLFRLVEGSCKIFDECGYCTLSKLKPLQNLPTENFKINLSNMSESEKEVAKKWLKDVAESRGKSMDLTCEAYNKDLHLAVFSDASVVQVVSDYEKTGYDGCAEDLPEIFLTFSKPTISSWETPSKKSEKELQLEELVGKLQQQLKEAEQQLENIK